jgi:hypothetical protein
MLARVTVTVPVLDSSKVEVSGATVNGSWTGAYNRDVSGSTNSQGQVIFSTPWTYGGTFTFTVSNITKTGWTYDSKANEDTSDWITVP